MFRQSTKETAAAKRHVILTIKSTGIDPEVDQITQIACVEMKNGKPTGQQFNSFVKVEDEDLLEKSQDYIAKNLKADQAKRLIASMERGISLKDAQKQMLDFLTKEPDTRIIVHFKKYVLDFMRKALDEEGIKIFNGLKMENMVSKSAKMGRLGLYHAGQYPKQIDTNRETYTEDKRRYPFNQMVDEYGVRAWHRTGFDALQDAQMLARAEGNRKSKLQEYKETHQVSNHATLKR